MEDGTGDLPAVPDISQAGRQGRDKTNRRTAGR